MPIILQTDLATAGQVSAVLVDGESQAYQVQAPETLRATVEHRKSQYKITAVITGLATQSAEQAIVFTRPDSGGLIEAVDSVAKEIDGRASPFSTHSDGALQAYTQAVTSSDAKARMASLLRATQLDPNFGLAYLSGVETASAGGPDALQNVLRAGAARQAGFTRLDRARFAAVRARLTHAPLSDQSAAAATLLQLTPNSLDALVSLASLRFLQGDGPAGKQLLEKGLALSPDNPVLRSYLAQGLVETRQFGEAARIYSSLQNDPAVLPQLAVCLLLSGDTRQADNAFEKFAAVRKAAGDQTLPLIQGNWLAVSGRVPEAIRLLKAAPFSSTDLRSLALSQAAVWELMTNDLKMAKADADSALRLPSSQQVRAIASAAAVVCSGSQSADDLRASVGATPLREEQKAVVFAYGAFLRGYFGAAADEWNVLVKQSGGTDLRARIMRAASLQRAGRPAGTDSLPLEPFVPNLTADDQFGATAFQEMRRLLR